MNNRWLILFTIFLLLPITGSVQTVVDSEDISMDEPTDVLFTFINDSFTWEPLEYNGTIMDVETRIQINVSVEITGIPLFVFVDNTTGIDDVFENVQMYQDRFISYGMFTFTEGLNELNYNITGDSIYNLGIKQNISIIFAVVYNYDIASGTYEYQHSSVLAEIEMDYTKYLKPYISIVQNSLFVTYYDVSGNINNGSTGIDTFSVNVSVDITEELDGNVLLTAFLINPENPQDRIEFDVARNYGVYGMMSPGIFNLSDTFALINTQILEVNVSYELYVDIFIDYFKDNEFKGTSRSYLLDSNLYQGNFSAYLASYALGTTEIIMNDMYAEWYNLTLEAQFYTEISLESMYIQSSDFNTFGVADNEFYQFQHFYFDKNNGTDINIMIPLFHPHFNDSSVYDMILSYQFTYDRNDTEYHAMHRIEFNIDLNDTLIIEPIISNLLMEYTYDDFNNNPGIDFVNVSGSFDLNRDPSEFNNIELAYAYAINLPGFGYFTMSHYDEIVITPLDKGNVELNYYIFGRELFEYQEWNPHIDFCAGRYDFGIQFQFEMMDGWIFEFSSYIESNLTLAEVDPTFTGFEVPTTTPTDITTSTTSYLPTTVCTNCDTSETETITSYIDYVPSREGWLNYSLLALLPLVLIPLMISRKNR
ncbi:MAG: hypothetical protein INQ03_24825 [Candidatus Heimdallarchaeota archaeon]|nr:hypothetical protein [Candidatus Heimdallarchaeota archaeon]